MKKTLKDQVLSALESSNGSPISGQDLANQLGTSRAAIWKAIDALRKQGCSIEASSKVGYQLAENTNFLSKEGISTYLPNKSNFNESGLIFFQTIDSTNKEASRIISSDRLPQAPIFPSNFEKSGLYTAIVSNHQENGKGRLGRNFYSPKDTGLYISLIIKPQFDITSVILLTTMVSVVITKALEKVIGVSPKIKWVNDLYLDDKKVCGILSEGVTNFETGQIEHIVLGMGFNCFTKEFTKEAGPNAGSLSSEIFSRNQLAAEVILACEKLLLAMKDFDLSSPTEEQASLLKEYKEKSLLLGKEIIVLNTNKIATAIDIGLDGSLIIKDSEGNVESISSGEVSVRLA